MSKSSITTFSHYAQELATTELSFRRYSGFTFELCEYTDTGIEAVFMTLGPEQNASVLARPSFDSSGLLSAPPFEIVALETTENEDGFYVVANAAGFAGQKLESLYSPVTTLSVRDLQPHANLVHLGKGGGLYVYSDLEGHEPDRMPQPQSLIRCGKEIYLSSEPPENLLQRLKMSEEKKLAVFAQAFHQNGPI